MVKGFSIIFTSLLRMTSEDRAPPIPVMGEPSTSYSYRGNKRPKIVRRLNIKTTSAAQ